MQKGAQNLRDKAVAFYFFLSSKPRSVENAFLRNSAILIRKIQKPSIFGWKISIPLALPGLLEDGGPASMLWDAWDGETDGCAFR